MWVLTLELPLRGRCDSACASADSIILIPLFCLFLCVPGHTFISYMNSLLTKKIKKIKLNKKILYRSVYTYAHGNYWLVGCASMSHSHSKMSSQTANPVQLLQLHGDSLRSQIERINLLDFCDELCKFKILSRRTRENFRSIDCGNVAVKLKVRYLFNLICDKICENKALFSVLLIVLSSYGGEIKSMYNILNREYREGVRSMVGEAAQVQDLERCLTEGDIPDLLESLTDGLHKWEEISIALKLPLSTIEDIRIAGGSSATKLNKVLHAWVSGNYLKPVHLSVLKNVLTKSFVGLTRLADNLHLENIFPASERPRLDHSCPDSDIRILCQSVDASVSYGKSTLLEVQVNSSHSSVSYQWFKDGHELSYDDKNDELSYDDENDELPYDDENDDNNYINTKSSILLVRHRNMASKHIEGKYVCQVEGRIRSDEIPVTIYYSDRTRHLLENYRKLEEVPRDSWPPRCAKSFVELALIGKDLDDMGGYDYSVRGDMDDIVESKEGISYHEAFGRYVTGALVLVEGRPGCGKTTLAHKVTRDWSRGEKVLVGAELVFIVSLRILNMTQKDKNIDELMEKFYCSKQDANNMGQYLLSSQGDKVCFILDGFDEYHKKSDTYVEKLINGKLPKAMVIIFSRPVGTLKLKQSRTIINNQIEILGFIKDQIYSYIDSYFDTNTDMAHGLKEYLDLHINVLHMCYLPVHASMICYLYSQERDNLPTTETQIYHQFTTSTITRKLMREDKSFKKIALVNLCEKDKISFLEVCELAFEMTTKSIQVFHRSEESVQLCDELGSDGPSLGLVTVDYAAKTNGYEDFYSFLHLTFQEYLAAYFIFQSETEEQFHFLNQYRSHKSMVVVWKFYCGLIGLEPNSSFQDQINLIFTSEYANTLYRIHCAYESQQSISCDSVLDHANQFILSFNNETLNLADCNAMCHVISKASRLTLGLQFHSLTSYTNCKLDEVIKSCTSLQTLDIGGNNIDLEDAAALAKALKSCTKLQTLDISYNNVDSDLAAALAEGLKSCTKLQTLDISYNNVDSDCAAVLAEALKSCTKLRTLDISHNNIDSEGTTALAEILMSCTKLQALDIGANKIGSEGAAALAEGLKSCTKLKTLIIRWNNIDEGAATLAEGLKSCANLQTLDISKIKVGSDGLAALAEGLKSCINLQTLDIHFNSIGSDGAAALAEGLKSCINLQTLAILRNKIGSDGAAALADALTSCTNLETLDIRFNNIGSEGVVALAEGLKFCTNLQTLAIDRNNIGSYGAAVLAEVFKFCTNLQTLDIGGNEIDSEGAADLAEGLKFCTNLQTLAIHRNNIGSDGAAALAEVFKFCTNLQTLDIGGNKIDSKGAAALVEGLKSCTNLQTLAICRNNIGSVGAAALGKGLKYCTSLRTLDICFNSICSEGVAALAEGLKFCTSLQTLDISDSKIGSDGAAALADALKSCTNLQTLDICFNNIGSDGVTALSEGLSSFTSLLTLDIRFNNTVGRAI